LNNILNTTFGKDLDMAYMRELDNQKRAKKLTKNLINFCENILIINQENRLSAEEIVIICGLEK